MALYFHRFLVGLMVKACASRVADRLVGLVVKTSASRAEDSGFEPPLAREIFLGRVIQVTLKLALQWLPCQAPGVIWSALGQVGRCQYTVTG